MSRAPAPLIAITTSELRSAGMTAATPHADPEQCELVLGVKYIRAIEQAGGLPVVVPPLSAPRIEALLDRVDGVCLSGGPDLDPSAYGAAAHPRLGPHWRQLDRFELTLTRAADERGLPVFAICRGLQVLNVARGGTLHQHIPDVVGDAISHRQDQTVANPTHLVRVAAGTRLAEITGGGEIAVNSFHHQSIARLGGRLSVTARALDGTVEAIEATDREFTVGGNGTPRGSLMRAPIRLCSRRSWTSAGGDQHHPASAAATPASWLRRTCSPSSSRASITVTSG